MKSIEDYPRVPDSGTYALIIELREETVIEVGALGQMSFEGGYYVYAGSAFGPGGLGRIDRHRDVSSGENQSLHWHVDYLNYAEASSIVEVVVTEDDVECELARGLAERSDSSVADFGCSDCKCSSHLLYYEDEKYARDAALEAISESSTGSVKQL